MGLLFKHLIFLSLHPYYFSHFCPELSHFYSYPSIFSLLSLSLSWHDTKPQNHLDNPSHRPPSSSTPIPPVRGGLVRFLKEKIMWKTDRTSSVWSVGPVFDILLTPTADFWFFTHPYRFPFLWSILLFSFSLLLSFISLSHMWRKERKFKMNKEEEEEKKIYNLTRATFKITKPNKINTKFKCNRVKKKQ